MKKEPEASEVSNKVIRTGVSKELVSDGASIWWRSNENSLRCAGDIVSSNG
jgi:hypothetical protein